MAVMRSSQEQENLRRWVKASKDKAQHLLAQTDDLAKAVFASKDDFISFLDLTSRVHHYDANNLLLIWHSCPSACYLAGYKVWERQLPTGTQILKREHIGKGIDLVAPFTEGANESTCLVWHSRQVFDVAQTNSVLSPPSFDPVYIADREHEFFIIDALQAVLSSKFQKTLVFTRPTQLLEDTGLPGNITDHTVTARDDLSHHELLQWLTEAIAHLTIQGAGLPPSTERLLEISICYCLFQIWGIECTALLPRTANQLDLASDHLLFLNILRDSVRDLNNMVGSFYTARRQDEEENTLDLADIFDIPTAYG